MTITKIVKNINDKMNYQAYSYDELHVALNAAVDEVNARWRMNLPMITDLPEMTPFIDAHGTTVNKPTNYPNIPDDFIRMFIVPFAVAKQYTINEQDSGPEMTEAELNLVRLSERYGHCSGTGATEIVDPNFRMIVEETEEQFGDGHGNYAFNNSTDGYGDY